MAVPGEGAVTSLRQTTEEVVALYARMTTIHSPAERMDEGIDKVKNEVVGAIREVPGFKGIIGLVDRTANTGVTLSLWESLEAMEEAEVEGARLRDEAAKAMKAETEPMVNRYEVVLIEVDTPVTAA
jgi:heme-degrading monooxygenase HmoA